MTAVDLDPRRCRPLGVSQPDPAAPAHSARLPHGAHPPLRAPARRHACAPMSRRPVRPRAARRQQRLRLQAARADSPRGRGDHRRRLHGQPRRRTDALPAPAAQAELTNKPTSGAYVNDVHRFVTPFRRWSSPTTPSSSPTSSATRPFTVAVGDDRAADMALEFHERLRALLDAYPATPPFRTGGDAARRASVGRRDAWCPSPHRGHSHAAARAAQSLAWTARSNGSPSPGGRLALADIAKSARSPSAADTCIPPQRPPGFG